ncbi:MAG: radical SAM protein [Candidatus Sumerlaeia bacterium]|nr:radical SAM protein [Candidatus Sumerlaeia bacterium]
MAPPKATFFEPSSHDTVVCTLCPIECSIAPNRSGHCGVRSNRRGELVLDSYGRVSVLEPVIPERLPLFHHDPHLRWLLAGQRGCNMRCPFCTTSRYSQLAGAPQEPLAPEELVEQAVLQECGGVSFGIAEPVVSLEYVLDVFALAKQAGLKRHVATNGYLCEEPLRDLLAGLDAVTFGFKGADPRFHLDVVGGQLETTRHALDAAIAVGVHTEATYLVIPGRTDRTEDAEAFAELLGQTPIRFPVVLLPFEPSFQWREAAPASLAAVEAFRRLLEALGHPAYVAHEDSTRLDTRCGKCGRTLVRRSGAQQVLFEPGARQCPHCRHPLPFTLD